MKILLDECVPKDFCKSFPEHECHAARRAGFGGKRNGELIALAEQAGFDALITVDKRIPFQQNLRRINIAVLILNVPSNRLPDLLCHIPACRSALAALKPGQVVSL